MNLRIGQGLDVHAFAAGDYLMLGGERIPHTQRLAAHSDGDVVLHALCDALLGAAALGDIGRHFPPGDPAWENAAGATLLGKVMELVRAAGWSVVNTDVTVACEAPHLAPYVPGMRRNIAGLLAVTEDRVSVKATTTEGLGFCGRGEGIAALAVVLLTAETHRQD